MTKKRIIYILIALVVLVGLFVWLKPAKAPESMTTDEVSAPLVDTKTFELVIKEGKVVSGPTILTAGQGDRVIIKVMADVSDELHLHGYDVSTDLVKDVQGGIIFYAATTGRFAFELENAKIELGTLEVLPRQ